MAYYANW